MPITNIHCIICGGPIIEPKKKPHWSWLGVYNAYYSWEPDDPELGKPVYTSGLGHRYPNSDAIFPRRIPDLRKWTLKTLPDEDKPVSIGLMYTSFEDHTTLAMYGPPFEPQAWGYPFHTACSEIFLHHPQAQRLNNVELFNLCRSSPCVDGVLNWGHDYGGVVSYEPVFAPGEEPYRRRPTCAMVRDTNPLDPEEVRLLFEDAGMGLLGQCMPDERPSWFETTPGADPFEKVPTEILPEIVNHLPSIDVLHLKLASRTFANLVLPDSFWTTRFQPGREMEYVMESDEYWLRSGYRDLYKHIRHLETSSLSMKNRRRIWKLCQSLHGVLEMTQDAECCGTPLRHFYERHVVEDERLWITASRALQRPQKTLKAGSRVLCYRSQDLSFGMEAVFVSTIALFGKRYISGIRVVDKSSKSLPLGYWHPDSEVLLLKGDGLKNMRGFCVAQDTRGVRGLAVVSEDGTISDWVGEHHGIPKRMLVHLVKPRIAIDALKCGFDAVRLVSLSIPSTIDPEEEDEPETTGADRRLWWPDIPHPSISFLGISKLYRNGNFEQELPISYALISDPNDSNTEQQKQITRITIRTQGAPRPDHHLLGAVLSITTEVMDGEEPVDFGMREAESIHQRVFTINAHGGERITGLDTMYAHGKFLEFDIHTNYNRTCNFQLGSYEHIEYAYQKDLKKRLIRTEGRDVVGFWGMMSTATGFVDLGLVVQDHAKPGGA